MAKQSDIKTYGSKSGEQSKALDTGDKPDARKVEEFHANADTDTRVESLHHTLGPSPSQAAPGDHIHDGGTSAQLLVGSTISGSRASDAYRLSLNAILVKLGAVDSSTP